MKKTIVKANFQVLKKIGGHNIGSIIPITSRDGIPVTNLWRKYLRQGYIKEQGVKSKPLKASKSKLKPEDDLNV